MLFQRLYNWIKYKSLPVSFFFKNRLFIEKDTKHKRIYSLLGNVFRNSKWSNLELPNIKNQFRIKYFKFLLFSFLIIILMIFFFYQKNLNNNYIQGQINFLVWLLYDSFDYYLAFITWILIFIFYALLYWFYSYISEKLLDLPSEQNFERLRSIFSFFDDKHAETIYKQNFQKYDLKVLTYVWLNTSELKNKEKILENFFECEVSKIFWKKNYLFFQKLFKVSYYCNLMSEKFTLNYLHLSFNTLNSKNFNIFLQQFFASSDKNDLFQNNFVLFSWYVLKNTNVYFTVKNKPHSIFQQRYFWNITDFHIDRTNFCQDPFYMINWNFNKLNFFHKNFYEFLNITTSTQTQTDTAKWNRWLYKYSILHRRILKNSHKLTISKRLLTSGFYSKNFINKNTWVSHRWEKINKNVLSNLNYVNYSNFFLINSLNEFTQSNSGVAQYGFFKNKFNFFSHYENSFFWVNKRFYFLNTILSNNIDSHFYSKKTISDCLALPLALSSHFFFLTKLSSVFDLNLDEFFFFKESFSQPSLNINSYRDFSNYNNKDLSLSFEDHDFFNNEVLDIGYWISLNSNTNFNKPQNLIYSFYNFSNLTEFYNFNDINPVNLVCINHFFPSDCLLTDLVFINFLNN